MGTGAGTRAGQSCRDHPHVGKGLRVLVPNKPSHLIFLLQEALGLGCESQPALLHFRASLFLSFPYYTVWSLRLAGIRCSAVLLKSASDFDSLI